VEEVVMRLRDQLTAASLTEVKDAKKASPEYKACLEVSRCGWFFKDAGGEDAIQQGEGVKAVAYLERLAKELGSEDGNIAQILGETIDHF
jgi:hypothetical protein